MHVDYATLKSTGIDFSRAYSALESKLQKGKSEVLHGDLSINFLAIRQLSQNLRNQDSLERTRQKVLKSRSLPNNLKYKNKDVSFDSMDEYDEPYEQTDELDHADLALIHDSDFSHPSPHAQSHQRRAGGDAGAKAVAEPAEPAAQQKKKPNLFLHVSSMKAGAEDDHATAAAAASANAGADNKQHARPESPSAAARVSPRGTLYMGKWKVGETGISSSADPAPSANSSNSSSDPFEHRKRSYIQDHGYEGELTANGSYLWRSRRNEAGDIVPSTPLDASMDGQVLAAMGGKKDFVEIAALGSGASGVVTEALHVRSMTLVALKILPIYNQEKRQHVSRELAVLFRNLAALRLVDDRLDDGSGAGPRSCPNVLSLYNAFIDPRSGMINLVVEYMDGGSLEDLVKQGGCGDEQVLADIAYQTLNGLAFLHKHKCVHRDIKPANILWSSKGAVKIADFGISKALDKSSGFANSFVGTVCYMSPERISAEAYSFPCDIWSLGLTLLAVARGRFPISLRGDNSNNSDGVIGGPGGYWAMIQAICDDDPPTAGPSCSDAFSDFIDACLRKDPAQRWTARQLANAPFITTAVSPGKYDWSPEEFEEDVEQSLKAPSASSSSRGGGGQQTVQTPLTARLTSVAIARGSAQAQTPSNVQLVAEEEDEAPAVMMAIRLAHLERVLEKLALKLKSFQEQETKASDRRVSRKAQDSAGSSSSSLDNMVVQPDGKSRHPASQSDGHDDKILPIGASHSRTAGTSAPFASSARSVHFSDQDCAPSAPVASNSFSVPKQTGLRARANLKALELDVIDDDEDAGSSSRGAVIVQKLPKPSSYFLASSSSQAKDEGTDPAADEAKRTGAKVNSRVDYSKMIPAFDAKGLAKWRNLAHQLHLPLPVVLLGVRSTLGGLLDLDEVDAAELIAQGAVS